MLSPAAGTPSQNRRVGPIRGHAGDEPAREYAAWAAGRLGGAEALAHHRAMSVDVVFIVEPASEDGRARRWAHVYLSMEKAKADVAYWAAKDGYTTLRWEDETYCQTASSEGGELLYTIVHTAVRHDDDPVP